MANLWKSVRSSNSLSFGDWLSYFTFNGQQYPLAPTQTLGGKTEEIRDGYEGIVQGAYKSNGIVFACMVARMLVFSEARFKFRRHAAGRPAGLFGGSALRIIEKPWPGGTTGDLLKRALQDADLSGNFFAVRRGNKLVRARPDWMTIILGSASDPDIGAADLDAEVLGYVYQPGGANSGVKPMPLMREQVAHFAPIPDPAASYRGMSWLQPVIDEVLGDRAATTHKLKYFENGATPNLVVSVDAEMQKDAFEAWVDLMESQHAGALNAYKTLYLAAGGKAEIVGSDLKNVDFKAVQGHGETRIAAAAQVPPIIVGLSEGLEAATYSNYGQARRAFADKTIRPLWRDFAGALAPVIDVPPGADLWYEDRDVSFLQEDRQDEATIQTADAITLKALIDAGFEPETARDAVIARDFSGLKHTGLFSVQLQPPGTELAPTEPTNGNRVDGLQQLAQLAALKRPQGVINDE